MFRFVNNKKIRVSAGKKLVEIVTILLGKPLKNRKKISYFKIT